MNRPVVIVGVCGGIAAYRVCSLVRLLKHSGVDVQVMMTRSARTFIGAVTFHALTDRAVITDDDYAGSAYPHLELRDADLMVIAPATAATIARIAHGISDNVVAETALAMHDRLVVAPAMNTRMLNAPATQRNLAQLETDGVAVLGPDGGELACGDVGQGKFVRPQDLHDLIMQLLERDTSA